MGELIFLETRESVLGHCIIHYLPTMGRKYPPLYPFVILIQSYFHFQQHYPQVRLVSKNAMSQASNQYVR